MAQERAYINQVVQIGPESTSALGTAVSATKQVQALTWEDAIEADVAWYGATGHKYDSTQEENKEWASCAVGGNLDYNAIIYILSGCMGAVSPVAHLASVTAKDWIFTPPISGSVTPQTYTMERGDVNTRAHKYTYGLFTDFGYKGTRKDFTLNGCKMFMQPISDGITMTSNATAVPIIPIPSKQFSIYLDTTSAGLGSTLLTRVLSIDYSFQSVYDNFWTLNQAVTGFAGHIDVKPKGTVKMIVEADSSGMAMLSYLQSGVTMYMRVKALGTTAIASDGPGSIFNTFTHDMAVKWDKPDKFSAEQNLFAIPWNLKVVEDYTWGKAQTITVTNLLTAL